MSALRALVLFLVAVGTTAPAAADNAITVYGGGPIAYGESRQLSVYVPLSPNTISWSVNGITGGNATYGTISASGLYQAPAAIPAQNVVTVTATSTAYPDKAGSTTLTVGQSQVQLWSASPNSTPTGAFTLRLNGTNFHPDSQVLFGGVALATTYGSPTSLTVKGTASTVGTVELKVVNPGLGGTTSTALKIQVTAGTTTTSTGGTGDGKTPTPTPSPTPGTVSVALSPQAVTLAPFTTRQFSASVTGSSDVSVTYAVNGVAGGNASVGTISGAGLYTAPAAAPSGGITVTATSVAAPSATASAQVTIQGAPDPGAGLGTPHLVAARFLDQATFGPTKADITKVEQGGIDAWLNEQFAMAPTVIPNPGSMASNAVQQAFLSRVTAAPDQLRQRVAYALQQFIVISMNKNIYPNEIVPYLQILSADAFGNYRQLLWDISTSAQMGKYLDLANSNKPGASGGANENYARELMQLFTIGLVRLNADGTAALDGQGNTIPTYDQATVQQVALALTGWTYQGPNTNNWENFSGPLQPHDVNHDMRAKTILGCSLPANQTTVQDMNAVLDCLFAHPNLPPFVATRLIRNMVTSNPSPAYVGRVAAAFVNNGAGVRGDLQAVVKAILTDPEARNDAVTPAFGRVRDPIQHIAAFVRALGGTINIPNGLPWEFDQMGEAPLTPPSVFGFYSPLYRIPKLALYGPEFQIYTPTQSVLRGNMFWQIITNPGSDFTVDMSALRAANGVAALIDVADQTFLYGRMPKPMRQSIANAIVAQSDTASQVQLAAYLAALSGLYAVQY